MSLLKELKSYIPFKDKKNDSVSTSDVAWQIDHSLKVINLVTTTVIESDPNAYKSRFNKYRLLFFTLGYFPRGKVRAPKIVRPPEIISEEDINNQMALAYTNLEKFYEADKNSHFKHFIFGVLNKKRTVYFLQLHTTHHLKIIRDILK